jgi:hypothetical protein
MAIGGSADVPHGRLTWADRPAAFRTIRVRPPEWLPPWLQLNHLRARQCVSDLYSSVPLHPRGVKVGSMGVAEGVWIDRDDVVRRLTKERPSDDEERRRVRQGGQRPNPRRAPGSNSMP